MRERPFARLGALDVARDARGQHRVTRDRPVVLFQLMQKEFDRSLVKIECSLKLAVVVSSDGVVHCRDGALEDGGRHGSFSSRALWGGGEIVIFIFSDDYGSLWHRLLKQMRGISLFRLVP